MRASIITFVILAQVIGYLLAMEKFKKGDSNLREGLSTAERQVTQLLEEEKLQVRHGNGKPFTNRMGRSIRKDAYDSPKHVTAIDLNDFEDFIDDLKSGIGKIAPIPMSSEKLPIFGMVQSYLLKDNLDAVKDVNAGVENLVVAEREEVSIDVKMEKNIEDIEDIEKQELATGLEQVEVLNDMKQDLQDEKKYEELTVAICSGISALVAIASIIIHFCKTCYVVDKGGDMEMA